MESASQRKILKYNKISFRNPKGSQPLIFIGRTDAEAEAPILWPPDVKSSNSLEKTLMLGNMRAGGEGGDKG